MKFGVNLLLFSDTIDGKVREQFPRLRELGADGVEVPIFDPGSIAVDEIRSAAEREGLDLTASGALPPGTRFYEDGSPRCDAEQYMRDTIRTAAALGADVLCGPFYKPVGELDDSVPFDTQRRRTGEALAPLVAEADEAGVTVAIETLNRFETDLLNTVADGIALCGAAGGGAGLLLDTFHMNIEEKDSAAGITATAKAGRLAHVHASENDRGIAGTGQVRWNEVAEALRGSGYDRWVVLESFDQNNQAIRTAVSCWRPFYSSAEDFVRQGLAFVRERFG